MINDNFIRTILQTWALLKWLTYYLQTICNGFQVLKYAGLFKQNKQYLKRKNLESAFSKMVS